MKRGIAGILILLILALTFVGEGEAWPFSKKPKRDIEATFEELYPDSFLESTLGKVVLIGASAVLVASITYFTAGGGTAATAGPIAAWVGGLIGGLHGLSGIAAINYGLAVLGGGSIASGGLGILGGVAVLNVVGDVALAVALESAFSQIKPSEAKHDFVKLIKVRMFYDKVNPEAEDILKKLEDVLKNDDSVYGASGLIQDVERVLERSISGGLTKTRGYDYLLLAIINYNKGEYENAKRMLRIASTYMDNSKNSFKQYLLALIELSNGNDSTAETYLARAIEIEPKAIPPYVILAQMLHDNGSLWRSQTVLTKALDKADDDDFSLNWMLANFLYEGKSYRDAIEHYQKALSQISQNQIEALCKLNVAKCYKHIGETEKSKKWLEKAKKEVKDYPDFRRELVQQYYAN